MVVATGFIIFRSICKQIEFLLLQTSYGSHHWTPPKGFAHALMLATLFVATIRIYWRVNCT
jgi:hypothetical protein